jgi:DNA repair photolyase
MRWPGIDDERDGQTHLFAADGLTGPERGSGRMSGLEFHHVAARKIINTVPETSHVPFRWTINAYRGCSHACVYCLAGDTSVLMADGRTAPLSDVRRGDVVYGTTKRGNYRRYTPTSVIDHWMTVKRAFRISLADGTSLIASADHRFLTERGWKFVRPAETGQRPFLTTNNSLMGVGKLAEPPKRSTSYDHGYLTGMIRGDGHVGTYAYRRAGRSHGTVHRFRLALADPEPLERTRMLLERYHVRTASFTFTAASDSRRAMEAIRTSSRSGVDVVRRLIQWPDQPDDDWSLGFLAGIFDAEGSCSQGVLRISNADPVMLDQTKRAAERFGFRAVLEPPAANGVRCVRITGGLRERLRFFVSIDPATTRKRTIDDVALKSDADLRVVAVEDLGIEMPMYDITTGTGDFIANGVVSHNCFARPTHEYLGLDAGSDFDTKIVVKVNAVEKLRAELADPRWTGEHIAMGTNTDPYQRAEGKYRLTRGVVEALGEARNPFSILTKSALVTRDIDVLTAAAARTDVHVSFSVGTVDEAVWRATEPGTPHPRRRLDALRRLKDAGIHVGVLMAPVLPGLSDRREQIEETVAAILDAGGSVRTAIPLYLRGATRQVFLDWLAATDPDLHRRYLAAYAGRTHLRPDYAQWVEDAVTRAVARHSGAEQQVVKHA